MPFYTKRPVTIEAYQLPPNDDSTRSIPGWFIKAIFDGRIVTNQDGTITVKTLEGDHRGDIGDYIIKGVKGELYPCKPDIFVMTYDPVPDLA